MNRPMDPDDEERVERELQKRLQSERLHRYGDPGWDAEDMFANQCLGKSGLTQIRGSELKYKEYIYQPLSR